jgi:hypothetical protein
MPSAKIPLAHRRSYERCCGLCGTSLDGLRPHARFCSRACRVEAGRIRAILSPSNAEAWVSLKSRLESAQKASERPEIGSLVDGLSLAPQTAIGRLLSGIRG